MEFLPPGVSAAWADVRQFLAAVRFARPDWLWLGFAPLGDPMEIRLGNARLTLRRHDAAGIEIHEL